jgi:hypothetical protein
MLGDGVRESMGVIEGATAASSLAAASIMQCAHAYARRPRIMGECAPSV